MIRTIHSWGVQDKITVTHRGNAQLHAIALKSVNSNLHWLSLGRCKETTTEWKTKYIKHHKSIHQCSVRQYLRRGNVAYGTMFVTNWLAWERQMMQADCSSVPSRRRSGSVFIYPALVVSVLWTVAQQTKLRLENPQIPAGLWGTTPSCLLHHDPPVTSHLIIWSWPEKFSAEERFSATGPCMSSPLCLCGVEMANTVTPTLPPSCLVLLIVICHMTCQENENSRGEKKSVDHPSNITPVSPSEGIKAEYW